MGICLSLCTKTNNKYHEKELKQNSFENLKVFILGEGETKCKVVDVYDGDTITIVYYDGSQPIKVKFRMAGYDSPELRPLKTIDNRDLHKQAGYVARDTLKDRILGKILWVVFNKNEKEKYGRALGKLYEISNPDKRTEKDTCINQWMIDQGLGKEFTGKEKKEDFTLNELTKITTK